MNSPSQSQGSGKKKVGGKGKEKEKSQRMGDINKTSYATEFGKRYSRKLPNETIAPTLEELTDILTEIRSVNKTDSANLMGQFGTFAALSVADKDQLSSLPGLGPKKVKNIMEVFGVSFADKPKPKPKSKEEKKEDTSTSSSKVNGKDDIIIID